MSDIATVARILINHGNRHSGGKRLVWLNLSTDERLALHSAGLRGANLLGANLGGASLAGVDLRGANLRGADLHCAYLRWADLRYASLRYADLRSANLTGANLRGANLTNADLGGANLFGANLANANLFGANLTNADLYRADLRGADLHCAEGLPHLTDNPRALRLAVANHIEQHPELHDQGDWGDGSDNPSCGTPCCVAGWACHLSGGDHGLSVPTAATLLLHVDGLPMPSFTPRATREEILEALRTTEVSRG